MGRSHNAGTRHFCVKCLSHNFYLLRVFRYVSFFHTVHKATIVQNHLTAGSLLIAAGGGKLEKDEVPQHIHASPLPTHPPKHTRAQRRPSAPWSPPGVCGNASSDIRTRVAIEEPRYNIKAHVPALQVFKAYSSPNPCQCCKRSPQKCSARHCRLPSPSGACTVPTRCTRHCTRWLTTIHSLPTRLCQWKRFPGGRSSKLLFLQK